METHICYPSIQKAEAEGVSNFKASMGYKMGPCLSNLPHNKTLIYLHCKIDIHIFSESLMKARADACLWVMDSDWTSGPAEGRMGS